MKNTNKALHFFWILAFVLGLSAGYSQTPSRRAYIDPELLNATGSLAVIVRAGDSPSAARAVERLGGRVSSDLWLIGAVAATLPAEQLRALSASPGILAVTANQTIRTSDWDGWMTQRRVMRSNRSLEDNQRAPVAYFADGAYISITEKGFATIVGPDLVERGRLRLSGAPFKTAAVIIGGDTAVVASEAKNVYAIRSDASVGWRYADSIGGKFVAGASAGPDGRVFAADDQSVVYALDGTTGALLWKYTAGSGPFISSPAVGPDGVVYAVSDRGFLHAIQPDGTRKWVFNAAMAIKVSPIVGNGVVYLAAQDGKKVFAVNTESGNLAWNFQANSKLIAPPTLGPSGSLYVVAEDRAFYALTADGKLRFTYRPAGGHFRQSPALSPDEKTAYLALEEDIVYAVDLTSGAEQWRYLMKGRIKSRPVVDRDGAILIGSEGKDFVRLSTAGHVISSITLPGMVQQSASIGPNADATLVVGSSSLATIGRLPDSWDGSPDVQATSSSEVWDLAYPLTVDIGADTLHAATLPTGENITGSGVTIAVIDSGVYFDKQVKEQLGDEVQKLFRGQADFVDNVCTVGTHTRQLPNYCLTTFENSKDGYGHGTYVAGLIWNHYTDLTTGSYMGVAPGASILSVRVLNNDGIGTYENVIRGIQWVVENRAAANVRIMNLSLSATPSTPYFVDPLNRAVEAAWASGIVVIAAAGNTGPGAETISVPGNDPYVVTVGSVSGKRTAGYWLDDELSSFSATGPTLDGFVKPDVLAPGSNTVSFMYNDRDDPQNTAYLARNHPDYSVTSSLFRMSGTSMSTAVVSGVTALLLQVHPELSPDQVKFRLKYAARPQVTEDGSPRYSLLQQGYGRIWAPDLVLGEVPADGQENYGMDIRADLAHGDGWSDLNQDGLMQLEELDPSEVAYHYSGPVARLQSDDGSAWLYYTSAEDSLPVVLGVTQGESKAWMGLENVQSLPGLTWDNGAFSLPWDGAIWGGGHYSWGGGNYSWDSGHYSWGGGHYSWGGGHYSWGGGHYSWGGGHYSWGGGHYSWGGGHYSWGGGWNPQPATNSLSSTRWIYEP